MNILEQALRDADGVAAWMLDNNPDNASVGFATALGEINSVIYTLRQQIAAQHSVQRTCAKCGASTWANAIEVHGKEYCTVCGASR